MLKFHKPYCCLTLYISILVLFAIRSEIQCAPSEVVLDSFDDQIARDINTRHSRIKRDIIVYPSHDYDLETVNTKTLTESDIDYCTQDDMSMPFLNDDGEMECHPLLTQGPCKENQWFTLNEDQNAICRERDCSKENQDGHILFRGKCVSPGHTEGCPPGMEVQYNPFGYGECGCRDDFLPFQKPWQDSADACYQEYTCGPCQPGQQLRQTNEPGDLINLKCMDTGCPKMNEIKWADGNCYKVLSQCPLNSTSYAEFSKETRTVACQPEDSIRGVLTFAIGCNTGYKLNKQGLCQKVTKQRPKRNTPSRFPRGNARDINTYLRLRRRRRAKKEDQNQEQNQDVNQ